MPTDVSEDRRLTFEGLQSVIPQKPTQNPPNLRTYHNICQFYFTRLQIYALRELLFITLGLERGPLSLVRMRCYLKEK
jgi:hypothetical protein